tara:strand:+ start:1604 stop:2239 length:636 start_codon:yes stop_codon:yes gene_type:complete
MILIINGVVFLIRPYLFLPLLILSGCTVNSIENTFLIARDKLTTQNINVNEEFLKNKQSLAILQINSDDQFTAELDYVNISGEIWVSSSGHVFTINNGKITKTKGFDYDFITNFNDNFLDLQGNNQGFIRFTNPDSNYLEMFSTYSRVENTSIKNKIKDSHKYFLIEEVFSVPAIKWKGKNYYWINTNNKVIKSEQHINPFGDKLYITIKK